MSVTISVPPQLLLERILTEEVHLAVVAIHPCVLLGKRQLGDLEACEQEA